MRISDSIKFQSVNRQLATLNSQQADAARRAATGQRVGRPSADAVAAADLERMRARLERSQAHRDVIRTVRGDVELSEGMLAEATTVLARLREIAIQGANAALNADQRTGLASEVSELKATMVGIANTRGNRGSLFAGTATGAPAFDNAGVFQGNDLTHEVEVGPGLSARVNVSGEQAFTAAGGVDVFATIDALEAGLSADNQGQIATTLGDLEASSDQVVRARADAGVLLNRLDASDAALAAGEMALTERHNAVGAADPFEAISDLSQLSQALERAILVARDTLNNSVLRFG